MANICLYKSGSMSKHTLRNQAANLITALRIPLSVALLTVPAFSLPFYALYLIAGMTDILDGIVARKTNTVSAFGATLDSVADIIFVLVCLVKLLPALSLPAWLCIWVAIIALIRAINLLTGYLMHKRWITLHTTMNKVTGSLLFVLPLTLQAIDLRYSGGLCCAVATFATVQEGHWIRTGNTKIF